MKKFSTYKEMFDFLMSKGVDVRFGRATSCYGNTPDPGNEYLPCWMIRTHDEGDPDGCFYFAAGMDLKGDGKVWISGRTFDADEDILDNIVKTLGEIYPYCPKYRPDQIRIQVDEDYYYPRD